MGSRPRRCSRCESPISWWRNANARQGEKRWLCVDLSSDDNGYVQRIVTGQPPDQVTWGRVLSGVDLADVLGTGELLFTLHSRTCRAVHSKPNPKPQGLEIDWSAAQRSSRS